MNVTLTMPDPGQNGITIHGTVMCLRNAAKATGAKHLDDLADQIEAQIPPDEPTGLGAVVEDAEGTPWVRCENADREPHWYGRNKRKDSYADIVAVRVLSEGVQP